MHRGAHFLFLFASGSSILGLNGCESAQVERQRIQPPIRMNYENWVVTGAVANDGYGGGEVVALGLDGMRYSSRIDENQSFGIQLPGNGSYALYFLPRYEPNDTPVLAGHGEMADHESDNRALLNFEESPDIGIRKTLRLPKVLFNNLINLGHVDIKEGVAFPTVNPALSLDFDNDGRNDFGDTDDQNDGLNDLEQQNFNERIEICSFDNEDKARTISVPLTDLYVQLENGSSFGPCVAGDAPSSPFDYPIDASMEEFPPELMEPESGGPLEPFLGEPAPESESQPPAEDAEEQPCKKIRLKHKENENAANEEEPPPKKGRLKLRS